MKQYSMKFVLNCLMSASLLLASVSAHAWGYQGHRIAADVASGLLTQQARIRAGELLMGGSLADVASYMDDERRNLKRQIPGSDKWHYDNIPVCGNASVAAVCHGGDCASARIDYFSEILADRTTDKATRVFALKALVHLIGDIHQPLHAADDGDHGGNDVSIGSRNLHSEWDSGLVKKLVRYQSADDYALTLLDRYHTQIQNAQSGNATAWAMESHDLAQRVAYGNLPGFACGQGPMSVARLPASYYDQALPVVELQLVRAGARMAMVLNHALAK
ncbi:S1/P1 nuclease [Duganella vulcania]|uniref:S1/P1 Nuclease n=1 Tax=Duganella vulcania TaxID=2692166 RepID=A0A845GFY5_9BURK|nr:S1/P1 nuclease [Duganella vulcania]MYM92420.1 hypothetical protein [Duganella vulcania]